MKSKNHFYKIVPEIFTYIYIENHKEKQWYDIDKQSTTVVLRVYSATKLSYHWDTPLGAKDVDNNINDGRNKQALLCLSLYSDCDINLN